MNTRTDPESASASAGVEIAPAVRRHLDDLIDRRPLLASMADHLVCAFAVLDRCVRADRTIYLCGNGGSAADSEHIAAELVKGFESKRPLGPEQRTALEAAGLAPELIAKMQSPIAAVPLTGFTALRTAVANDTDPTLEFAQLAYALVREGDVLVAISTSGASANVIHAARAALARGGRVVAMTGERDSELSGLAEVTLRSPTTRTLEVQEYHLPMYHTLALMLETSLFGGAETVS